MPLTAIDANRPSPSKGQNSPGQDVKQTLNQAEKCLPRWMENMGFVARFFMYEIDQRFAKKFVLYFYLEDGSISIGESPDYSRLSSGPPPHEALFLRRHRVLKANQKENFTILDFSISATVVIYGRAFYIYHCDQFTRNWFDEKYGIQLAPSEPEPEDNLFPVSRPNPLVPREQRLFNPANAGHPTVEQLHASRKFLHDDGGVLRFWVLVNPPDQSLLWDEKEERVKAVMLKADDPIYVMRHFLADDTTELILDKQHRKLGRGYPTTLIKRCVWPSDINGYSISGIGNPTSNRLTQHDLQPGKLITAFGRNMLILKADSFTCMKISLDYQVEEIIERHSVPKKAIVSKPEKKPNGPSLILRAVALMLNHCKIDNDRKFIIEYYTEDESVAIIEHSDGRSRKFLEKTSKYKGKEFRVEDLQVDRICTINKFHFVIIGIDENTNKWLQNLSNTE